MINNFAKNAIAVSFFCMGTCYAINPVQCVSGKESRLIEVHYVNPENKIPCEVHYTKETEKIEGERTQRPWRAQNKEGYCEEKAKFLQDKLETLGWTCKPKGM